MYKKRQKNSFFHKPSQKENIPLLLRKLIINNYVIKQTQSINFFFLGGDYWMKRELEKTH